jgi:hypothetical protein
MSAKSTKSETADEPEPEQSSFEKGEWVDATVDGENPPIGLPVWYAVPGGDPDVRLGVWDGQTYTETSTGRSSTDAEVTGYKELYSEAPSDPGFVAPEPADTETPEPGATSEPKTSKPEPEPARP